MKLNSVHSLGFLVLAASVLIATARADIVNVLTFQNNITPWTGAPSGAYAGTEDTSISSGSVDFNYGSTFSLGLRDRSIDQDALLRFNMSSVTPYVSAATVTGATLTLVNSGTIGSLNANTNFNRFQVFLVSAADASWLEGNVDAATPSIGSGATYSSEIYNTTLWSANTPRTPVGLSGGTNGYIGQMYVNAAQTNSGNTYTINLTGGYSQMQTWLSGGANAGLVIIGYGGDAGSDGPIFALYSSESATEANRPRLTLYGEFNVVPEPGSLVLMGIGLVLSYRFGRRLRR